MLRSEAKAQETRMTNNVTVIAAAAISGTVGILAALVGTFGSVYVKDVEVRQKNQEYQLKRRAERQESYQAAIDLLTDMQWRTGNDTRFDMVRDFTIPFIHAANKMRVYGSPESIAAIDELQEAFARSNRAKDKSEREAAITAISVGQDHLVTAARTDVGPRKEDELKDVPFRAGAGPRT
jgi:hypothetical protein